MDATAWLGMDVSRDAGAIVTEIEAGSPAAHAGLRPGDIIMAWDNHDVDHKSLPWIVAQTPPGKPIAVGVWRAKAAQTITVVTEKMRE